MKEQDRMPSDKSAILVLFYGIEAPDILCFLARILGKLNKKVLIVDYSLSQELEYTIPFHAELPVASACIDYGGIGYTRQLLTNQLLHTYDIIFLNMGFRQCQVDLMIHRMIAITDLKKVNLKRLAANTMLPACKKELLVRDTVSGGLWLKGYLKEVSRVLKEDRRILFRYCKQDIKARLRLEYNDQFTFCFLSKAFSKYLLNEVMLLYPEIPEKQVVRAYQSAAKGSRRNEKR